MCTGKHGSSIADLAVNYTGRTLTSINIELLCETCEDVHPAMFQLRSIYKNSSAVVV